MRNADDEDLKRRLAAALDEVQPRFSLPRYATVRPRSLVWRLAPAVLAATALSALVVSAYAGTGSPDPKVWTETVVNVVAPPVASPAAEPTRTPPKHQPSQQPAPEHHESPEPRQSPEPHESPEGTSDSSDSGR